MDKGQSNENRLPSTVTGEESLQVSIPIKVAKMVGQGIILLVAGALSGGGTTLAIRGINPPNYDRYTGADADRAHRRSAEQRALIWKELDKHLLFSKETVHEWENVLDELQHDITASEGIQRECLGRLNRLDGRLDRIESRLWKRNGASGELVYPNVLTEYLKP